jgi:hypothetical protein
LPLPWRARSAQPTAAQATSMSAAPVATRPRVVLGLSTRRS